MKNLYLLLASFSFFIPSLGISQSNSGLDLLQKKTETLEKRIDTLEEENKSVDDPFKFTIGASFDFLSGSRETDLYYDVGFFVPEIWKADNNKIWKRIGLDVLFYQTRLLGDTNLIELEQAPKFYKSYNSDTLLAESYTLLRRRSTIVENLGLSISPTFKIKENLYLFLHWEGIIQTEKVNLVDKYSEIDSLIKIRNSEYEEPTSALRKIKEGSSNSKHSDFRGLLGIGCMLDFTIAKINFRLKPVFGYTKNRPWMTARENENLEGLFYSINLRLIETSSGLKIGGGVRNIIGSKNSYDYNIYLAKQFSVSKLGDFIKSK